MPRNTEQYFATLPFYDLEMLGELKIKLNAYRNFCASSGLASRWSVSMGAMYGVSEDGKQSWRVTPGGEMGELVQMKVNDYATLLQHELVLAIKDRPAGIAKAVNTDVTTLRNARIGTQLIEYYLTDPAHHFEDDFIMTLFMALSTAEAFIVQDWDTSKGPELRPDEQGNEMRAGDLVQKVVFTWNAARDIGGATGEQPWYIFSERINKWDLAAKYQAHAEAIKLYGTTMSGIQPSPLFPINVDETDFIEVHKLVHLPTPACPKGRYTVFIPDEILLDAEYPYPCKNFHRLTDKELIETPFGHTSNYDLLSLEQVTDALHSIVLNNQTTFGVSTIVGPKGAGLAQQELGKGLRYLELDASLVDKLKPLNLTATPVEVFNYINMLGQKKDTMTGINSIIKGDPQGMLKGASGAAMALLQAQAITYNSGFQKAFYKLLSSAGTGIIEMNRAFADEPRVVKIAGKANKQAIKEFKFDKSTLESVSTVIFESVNPMLQTAAGKMNLADKMVDKGMLTNPRKYIEVYTTGNLNVALQDEVTIEEAILEENEELADGIPVEAVITENHEEHIKGHQAVISLPNQKKNLPLVQMVTDHINQHIALWTQASMTNPALLLATGQKVLPVGAPPGAGPSQGQPAPNGAAPAGAQGASPSGPPPGQNSGTGMPNLPKPPVNPATGQRAEVPPGTDVQ